MRLLALATLVLLLTACAIEDAPPPMPADPAMLGQQVFSQWCVPCHGSNGEGFINALDAPALNADGESYLLSDEAILKAIIDGGAESGGSMAPLGNSLTEEQEMAVLTYVHSLWSAEQQAEHEAAGGHFEQE